MHKTIGSIILISFHWVGKNDALHPTSFGPPTSASTSSSKPRSLIQPHHHRPIATAPPRPPRRLYVSWDDEEELQSHTSVPELDDGAWFNAPSTMDISSLTEKPADHQDSYSADSNPEAMVIQSKIARMLERKIDLWPPEEIFDILPLLMKGDAFEVVMEERLNSTVLAEKERRRLEHSIRFIGSLKYMEQQRVARQWIESIIETATISADAMDERVFDLIQYENQVMVQPVLEELDVMMRRLQEMSPDEKTLTQFVIETLKKRIEAEMNTTEMPFVRLLALLLRLPSPEEQERVLRTELRNSRVIDEFAAFLVEGADYMARLRLGPYNLPDDTPEKMQGILAIVESFRRPVVQDEVIEQAEREKENGRPDI